MSTDRSRSSGHRRRTPLPKYHSSSRRSSCQRRSRSRQSGDSGDDIREYSPTRGTLSQEMQEQLLPSKGTSSRSLTGKGGGKVQHHPREWQSSPNQSTLRQ
eukprot:5198443-Amphidinium_carterae.1